MPHDDMFVFSNHIPVEVNGAAVTNPDGCDFVQGCVPHKREPHSLAVQWVAPTQMVQLTPGHRWCACCSDVRPESFFDRLEDGKLDIWCKMCRAEHTPWLRPTKYCSSCRLEKKRAEFSIDLRNVDGLESRCKACEAERSRARYREKVGREVRPYSYHEAR